MAKPRKAKEDVLGMGGLRNEFRRLGDQFALSERRFELESAGDTRRLNRLLSRREVSASSASAIDGIDSGVGKAEARIRGAA